MTNHFEPKLITHLTGDVEKCAPVFCNAEGCGSRHKDVRILEVNGKGFCVTSGLRHEIYVDRCFGTTCRSKMTSIGCPETSVRNYAKPYVTVQKGLSSRGSTCLSHARRATDNCSVLSVLSHRIVLELRSGKAITGTKHLDLPDLPTYSLTKFPTLYWRKNCKH